MFERAMKANQEIHDMVDEEAASLVRKGVPLWEAIVQARESVRRRLGGDRARLAKTR